MSKAPKKKGIATRSVRAGLDSDAQHGSVVPPIYLSTNFAFEKYRKARKYDYTRSGNPTRDQLSGALADLEGGAGAVVTCTGLSAITLILATLPGGARVVAPHDCYGGTYRLLAALHSQGKLAVEFVDQGDPAALRGALEAGADLVWIETPSNPLAARGRHPRDCGRGACGRRAGGRGQYVPVAAVAAAACARRGHGHALDHQVFERTQRRRRRRRGRGRPRNSHDKLAWWANAIGVTGAPFDSFLTLRGVRTLHARMRVHAENTAVVVEFLSKHPGVERVYYPGLPDHPGHEIARRQQQSFGAMLSFELAGGEAAVEAFLTGLECFTLAESLGGVESLISHPATMTHAGMEESARAARRHRAGIAARFRGHRRFGRSAGRSWQRPGAGG